jgi:hypothetical protein
VIRTIDQVVDFEFRAAGILLPELIPKQFEVAPHLAVDEFGVTSLVVLFEAPLGLVQAAILLLDNQHIAGLVDDDEVDLAERGPIPVRFAPMNTVVDEVFVGQAVPQSNERLYFVILKSIGSDGFDVGGENLSHWTYLPFIFNGLRMMQE